MHIYALLGSSSSSYHVLFQPLSHTTHLPTSTYLFSLPSHIPLTSPPSSHSAKPQKRPKRHLAQRKPKRTRTPPNVPCPRTCSSPRTGGRGSSLRTLTRALGRWASCWEPSGRSLTMMRKRYVCGVLWVGGVLMSFRLALCRAGGEG
jgi:hypothetical protein